MQLDILSPEITYFSGEVYGVQLPGISGLFEILDNHAPMVAALQKGQIKILLTITENKILLIEKGVVEVLNNKVIILVESIAA